MASGQDGRQWDADKAASNAIDHDGVTFEEAATVFSSATIEKSDALHADRVITIGFSSVARLLMVVTTEVFDGRIRIISARRATKAEHAEFAKG